MIEQLHTVAASPAFKAVLLYGLLISLTGAALAAADKKRAVKKQWRISEKTLMLCGLLGGAAAMYLTMQILRHKTHHPKFMIGLPIEIIVQIALFVILFLKFYN